MMVASRSSSDATIHSLPDVRSWAATKLRMRLDSMPLRRYRKTDDSFWTVGWLPCRFDRLIAGHAPDIVHLHWVGAGYLPVQALKQFRCPIVWTLRDMWPMTGGCHYTAGCERYRGACGECPQLRSGKEEDLSRAVWRGKHRHWRGLDLWLVPISRWLDDCVRSSPLLRDFHSEVIPNGLDISQFTPADKQAGRATWGLPTDRQIIVYGAVNATTDARKGFAELLEALKILGGNDAAGRLLLVVFGDLQPGDIPDYGIETRFVGYVDDNTRLSRLYAAADVAVMPSLQEAFGKTVIEAMSCGTPVVAFSGGGPDDIIEHCVDGYLAQAFRPDALAEGIAWCLRATAGGIDLGGRARKKVQATFDIDIVATRYRSLYDRILARSGAGRGATEAAQ